MRYNLGMAKPDVKPTLSKRNLAWLAAIVIAGLLVGISVGPWWGVLAAVVVLVVSEVVERTRRSRRARR